MGSVGHLCFDCCSSAAVGCNCNQGVQHRSLCWDKGCKFVSAADYFEIFHDQIDLGDYQYNFVGHLAPAPRGWG